MRPARGPRPIGDLVAACVGAATATRGFAGAEILARWPAIAGPETARHARPLRLQWPPRGERADPERAPPRAVLVLRVESAFALELQHQAPALIERINAYLGWACVGAIRLRQGPVGAPAARPVVEAVLGAEARRRLDALVAPIEEPGLAASLERLGAAVLGSAPGVAARE